MLRVFDSIQARKFSQGIASMFRPCHTPCSCQRSGFLLWTMVRYLGIFQQLQRWGQLSFGSLLNVTQYLLWAPLAYMLLWTNAAWLACCFYTAVAGPSQLLMYQKLVAPASHMRWECSSALHTTSTLIGALPKKELTIRRICNMWSCSLNPESAWSPFSARGATNSDWGTHRTRYS